MTEAQAIEAMTQRLIDAWPSTASGIAGTPYRLEGEIEDSAATWIRVAFRPVTEDQATLGRPARFDYRGLILAQLFADVELGAAAVAELAESVRTVFRSRSIVVGSEEITTYAAAPRSGPIDGRWAMAVMSIPYWFDQQA